MGGNAIKAAQRVDKTTFDQYWNELAKLFPELTMQRTLCYREKADFGDIDVVVMTDPSLNIKQLVRERINPLEEYDNGPFYSFLYKTAQVDFIFHSPEDYEIALHYYSYNDVCNFIGRVARSLNFKFGHDGLWYEEHLDDHYKLSVFVSRDIEKILKFLGYSYEKWLQGFDTIQDILEYGASSRYFNALYFSLEEQNNVDRVRNKKRQMYQKMLAYITANNLQPKPKLNAEEKVYHAQRAVEYFKNNFLEEIEYKRAEYRKHLQFKTMFNGDIVRDITGFEGKELGAFMQQVKTAYPNLEDIGLANGPEYVMAVVKAEFEKRKDSVRTKREVTL